MAKENATGTKKRSNTPLLIIRRCAWWSRSSRLVVLRPLHDGKTVSDSSGNSNKAAKSDGIPPNAPPELSHQISTARRARRFTLEEFADFQCPQCAMQHPNMNEIKSMYGSRIRFIFREYPLDIKAHDKSYDAAVARRGRRTAGQVLGNAEHTLYQPEDRPPIPNSNRM
jgi:hypothetical protein